ncbi:Fic family protein [Lysobacter korlensis]|uniref:Fic family protein n=1 Tax=Lysobacter korlensis TaxID=553636 RepID=A0ABV6RS58_9GAMM
MDLDGTAVASLNAAASALGELKGSLADRPNADLLTRTLARREAVQSSQIEGTKSELRDVLAYEVTRSSDGSAPDVVVTERYVEALQLGLDAVRERGRAGIDLNLVRAMHAHLMQDEPESFPKGHYRDRQVWIGGSARIEDATFVPAPPSMIAPGMRELEASMLQYAPREHEALRLPPLQQLAIAHAQFETIHPFVDGNGRVGRLLMPLILAAEGYPPLYLSGALLRNRTGYYNALNQVQVRGNWSPWITLACRAVVESTQDAIAIARDFDAMLEGWGTRLQKFRIDSVARRLAPLLLGHPVVDAARVAQLMNVSDRSARTGIDALVDGGILYLQKERKRNRVWEARALIDRLNKAPP